MTTTRLYDLKRGEKIKISNQLITFRHLDGAFSLCETENGEKLHLSASTPLVKIGEYWHIVWEHKHEL